MTTSNTSTGWDQQSFETCDRRGARKTPIMGAMKGHDLLHLACDPALRERVHEFVCKHTRHTDTVHAHDDALVVTCAPGEAAGLHAKLAGLFGQAGLPVLMSHGTFPAASDITHNAAELKG